MSILLDRLAPRIVEEDGAFRTRMLGIASGMKDVIALEKAAVHAPGNLAKLALSDPFADEETARREAEEREDARSKHEAKMEIKLQKKMEKQQLREAQAAILGKKKGELTRVMALMWV